MKKPWPQFPLHKPVWLSSPADLISFEYFLNSTRRDLPVLLLPMGSGVTPSIDDVLEAAARQAHVVRLAAPLIRQLSEQLDISIPRLGLIIFWPVATQGPGELSEVAYLPRRSFTERLAERLQTNLRPAAPKKIAKPTGGLVRGQLHPAPRSARAIPRPARVPAALASRPQPQRVSALAEGHSARESYRAFFQVQGETLRPTLKSLGDWLTGKGIEADLSRSSQGQCTTGDRHVAWQVRLGTSTRSDALHFEMTETTTGSDVTFTTVLTAQESSEADNSWVFLHVYNDGRQTCGTPRLATSLINALHVEDGGRPLSSQPVIISAADAASFHAWMRGKDRRLPVQVVATDYSLPREAVSKLPQLASQWTKSLAGQSHVVVLDPEATARFNALVPEEFRATPWTLRTYRPGTTFTGALEARQQREVSTRRLANSSEREIDRLLVGATRAITQQYPVPAEVRQVQALLARMERALRRSRPQPITEPAPRKVEQSAVQDPGAAEKAGSTAPADTTPSVPKPSHRVEPAPVPSIETDTEEPIGEPGPIQAEAPQVPDLEDEADTLSDEATQLIDAILQVMGADTVTDDVVSDVLALLTEPATQADTAEEVEAELQDLQERHEELIALETERRLYAELAEAELLEAKQELLRRDRELRYLRQELEGADAAAAAYSYVDHDPMDGIVDILTVIDKVSELTYIVATWDEDEVLEVDEIDNYGTVPKVAWSALTEMERYCQAKATEGYDKGFDHYLAERGEMLTPKRVAMSETTQTMKRWGEERRFKVPTEVHPSGSVLMEAHIKLTQDGANSPRMHFFDDTRGTGKIYVGYLGRHLTNTQTANM